MVTGFARSVIPLSLKENVVIKMRLIDGEALYNSILLYINSNAYLNDTPLSALQMVADWTYDAEALDLVLCGECRWRDTCKAVGEYKGKNGYCSLGNREEQDG